MKNAIKVLGLIVFVAIIGFSMAACSNGNDSGGNGGGGTGGGGTGGGGTGGGSNPFVGTWKDADLTVTCTATKWTATNSGRTWTGPYTPDGNSADFTETNGTNFGHATISGNTMTVVSTYGTFHLTKQ